MLRSTLPRFHSLLKVIVPALLFSTLSFAQTAPVRVMPLGDSITGSPGCWRQLLWANLRNTGFTGADFVGTLNNSSSCGVTFDGNNEGHGGFLATDVANQNLLPGWLAATRPDIVMMHFGTNDVWNGRTPTVILAAFSRLVDQMRASNPNMKILVAQIIPVAPSGCGDCPQRTIAFNAAIPGWAAGKSTAASPIIVVDQWNGFNSGADTVDGVHPNSSGNAKIANRWYPALTAAIRGQSTSPDYALSAPSSHTITRSSSTTVPITISRSGGFTGAVSLNASRLPSGVTATLNPSTATGNNSTLTLTASSTASLGTSSIAVSGTGGGLNRSTEINLTVNASGGSNGVIANGTYRISPRHSPDKALDVNAHGTADGSNVIQWTYGGGTNQQWALTHLGNNEYRITGVESGKTLEAVTTSTANGTNVDIRTYSGASNQRWTITATNGGFYRLTPLSSTGSALDVAGNSTANGANVQIWAFSGANNQQWSFQATSVQPPPNPNPNPTPTFKKGINISHWLSQNYDAKTYGASWFDREDVAWIAQQGFDHIRFPIDGRIWLLPDGSLDLTKIRPFEQALAWARELRLGAVLDMHFLPGASFDPNSPESSAFTDQALQARVADFWRRVASRFANEGPYLRFEILNEPVAPQNQQLNSFNTRMLAAIRETNPTRIVYITSNQFSQLTTLPDLAIPNDPNIAITVHYYEPLIFTHQRASWLQLPANMPVVNFPGTVPNLNGVLPSNHFLIGMSGRQLTVAQIEEAFLNAANLLRARAPGKEVHLGEFGAFEAGPIDGRRTYVATVARAAERQGWGWAAWDYQDSFGVRAADGQATPLLRALLP